MVNTPLNDTLAKAVAASSPDGLIVCDDRGLITYANDEVCAMSGFSVAELIGSLVEKLVPPDASRSHPGLRNEFVEVSASRRMGPAGNVRLLRHDGTEMSVAIALHTVSDDTGTSVVASIRDISERMDQERRLLLSNEALSLAAERERIGRDLHDTVLQHLYALGLEMQALEMAVDESLADRVGVAVDQIDRAIREIRTTVFTLSAAQRQGSFGQEIQDVVQMASRVLGFSPRVVIDGAAELLIPPNVRVELFATLREALGNVARHAHATEALVEIRVAHDLYVTVDDNGVGISQSALGTGNGLGNLASRAESLGGTFEIRARPSGGTRLTWRVPL